MLYEIVYDVLTSYISLMLFVIEPTPASLLFRVSLEVKTFKLKN